MPKILQIKANVNRKLGEILPHMQQSINFPNIFKKSIKSLENVQRTQTNMQKHANAQ